MPTDRVLIEIVTAANMAGANEAKAGFLGFTSSAMVATAALGVMLEVGKAMIETTREHMHAEAALANAIKNRGANAKTVELGMAQFMQTNRDFISNQAEVISSYAALIREGVKAKDLSRLMTTAINIQAIEGGTLTEAVTKLQMAEVGRNRGLALAVGLVLKAVPAHATYAQKLAIVAYNLRQVEKAYKNGKLAVDPLTRAENVLKTDWEKLATKYGPDLIAQLSAIAKEIDKNMPTWEAWLATVSNVLSQLAVLPDMANASGRASHEAIAKFIAGPAGMPSDSQGASIYAQQHAGSPSFAGSAHTRPYYDTELRRMDLLAAAAARTPAARAEAARREKAEAAQLLALNKLNAHLANIAEDTRRSAILEASAQTRPIIVKLDAWQIANQIRIAERRLR